MGAENSKPRSSPPKDEIDSNTLEASLRTAERERLERDQMAQVIEASLQTADASAEEEDLVRAMKASLQTAAAAASAEEEDLVRAIEASRHEENTRRVLFKDIESFFSAKGFKLEDPPGDGNCFFQAVLFSLGGKIYVGQEAVTCHKKLRKYLSRYMRRNKGDQTRADEISKEGSYAGDEPEIIYLSRLSNTQVHVYSFNQGGENNGSLETRVYGEKLLPYAPVINLYRPNHRRHWMALIDM